MHKAFFAFADHADPVLSLAQECHADDNHPKPASSESE
jgi:hypothetical protein